MIHSTPRLSALGNSIGGAIGTVALLALGCAGQSMGDTPVPPVEQPIIEQPIIEQPPTVTTPTANTPTVTTPDEEVPVDVPLDMESDAAEACSQLPHGRRAAASEADFQEMIVGNWLLCASPSVFGTMGEAGLAIYEDFRWAKLTRGDDGQIHASGGWEQEGRWETIDTSSMNGPGNYQLNLSIDGSGTVMTAPVFAEQPAVVRLNNMGVFVADYVKL